MGRGWHLALGGAQYYPCRRKNNKKHVYHLCGVSDVASKNLSDVFYLYSFDVMLLIDGSIDKSGMDNFGDSCFFLISMDILC